MVRLLRKLVFWGVVLLVLRHSFTIAMDLMKALSTSTRVAVTAANLSRVDAALQREKLIEGGYPLDFGEFMDRSFHGDVARNRLDNWGKPFRYVPDAFGYTVSSAGPDERFDTADDMSITRQGEFVTRKLYGRAEEAGRVSVPKRRLSMADVRRSWSRFAARVRNEWFRLKLNVKKARLERTRQRALRGKSRR